MDDGSMDSSEIDRNRDAQPTALANSASSNVADANNATDAQSTASADSASKNAADVPSKTSTSGISFWGKSLKIPLPAGGEGEQSPAKSAFARLASGLSMRLSPRDQTLEQASDGASRQSNIIGNITKGIVDSSKSAVKAVTDKARHVVSQNKRRYQEGGFDLDMTYITENIIAMGFPAGDMSSGFFGYVEGMYRNHMEEVIRFFETRHKGKYKVYNLCSERLYDASLFEGKVACFPFDDHNCPPLHLIKAFCLSAYSWLKEDLENVVVVHCKAGMARTGLMISSLILYLKFFPTAEESIDYYNKKRCYDAKALVLPSQIRYVKYFERILTHFNGDNQPGRRCMLRGFRFHHCPYWIRPHISICDHSAVLFSTKGHPRTKDQSPEEFWFSAPTKKGIMVFALPGEPGLTELEGDFKVHFHDHQGDFYFWLNTTMIENRMILNTNDIDGFDKRKLPSPGFQIEVVLVDYEGPPQPEPSPPAADSEAYTDKVDDSVTTDAAQVVDKPCTPNPDENSESREKDDVFSDADGEEGGAAKSRNAQETSSVEASKQPGPTSSGQVEKLTQRTEQIYLAKESSPPPTAPSSVGDQKNTTVPGTGSGIQAPDSGESGEFKVVSADASVFTFGDEEDFESD